MHIPLPCMPPAMHAPPPLPHMPPHHAHPPAMHAPLPRTLPPPPEQNDTGVKTEPSQTSFASDNNCGYFSIAYWRKLSTFVLSISNKCNGTCEFTVFPSRCMLIDETISWELLVSTYVVCERLSVMHEPAGVVENLVQNSTVYPYSAIQNTPPPPTNCQKSWHFNFSVAEYPPTWKIHI